MPEIARFFGIIVRMYFDDHNPPHFHARYGEYRAVIDIRRLTLLGGALPPRAMGLTIEWAARHQQQLLANWERARSRESLEPIEPLE